MKGIATLFCLFLLMSPILASAESQTPMPAEFRLGFRLLADQIPGIVGSPLEGEHHGANGDGLQQTTEGLMVWRKADNWTAFTNGTWTWVNGPQGVVERSNDERFPWEADDRGAAPLQTVIQLPPQPQPVPAPPPQPQPPAVVSTEFDSATEKAALDMLNASRAQFGVAPLVMDETIRQVARAHAKDMGVRNFFAHNNPDGKSPFDRLKAAGVRYSWAAENLGMGSGYRTALECVRANHDAMMAETPPDDGHRKNILNPNLRKIGIGVYRTFDGRTYYVTDFTD